MKQWMIVFACLSLWPLGLRAGNTRSFFYGDEAAMTGGAGVAISRDSGSLWYNPAGLGGLTLGRMELSGTAYNAKLRSVDGFLTTALPAGEASTGVTFHDFGAVPTSLVFVRNASENVSIGLGWLQTADGWVELRSELFAPFDDTSTWTEGVEYNQRFYAYHVGPAVGWQVNPRFRIGFALYFVWRSFTGNFQGFAIRNSGDNLDESFYSNSQHHYEAGIGAMLTTGIQWEFQPGWHMAVVVRSPTVQIVSWNDGSTLKTASGAVDGQQINTTEYDSYESDLEWGFDQVEPIEFQAALAYKTKDWWLGAEAAVRPPLYSEDQRFLWNASIGGRRQISNIVNVGAGLFTDISPNTLDDTFLNSQLNRYGISLGIEFRTPLIVKNPKQDKSLIWTTTIAGSLSMETGKFPTVDISPENEDIFLFPKANVTFYQGFLHLGTALYF